MMKILYINGFCARNFEKKIYILFIFGFGIYMYLVMRGGGGYLL